MGRKRKWGSFREQTYRGGETEGRANPLRLEQAKRKPTQMGKVGKGFIKIGNSLLAEKPVQTTTKLVSSLESGQTQPHLIFNRCGWFIHIF